MPMVVFACRIIKVLHRLQSSLVKAFGLAIHNLSSLHQVLLCKTEIKPWLRQFWKFFKEEPSKKKEQLKGWKNVESVLQYHDPPREFIIFFT